MKLYNRTKCPDSIIKPLLRIAGQSVGARTSNVIVILTQNRHSNICGGKAYSASAIKRRYAQNRWVNTDCGYITMTFPRVWGDTDMIDTAFRWLALAAHEFGHIRDFQTGYHTMAWSGHNGERRPKWARRPEEIRACNYTDDAMDKLRKTKRADDAVLALAEWFDAAQR